MEATVNISGKAGEHVSLILKLIGPQYISPSMEPHGHSCRVSQTRVLTLRVQVPNCEVSTQNHTYDSY